MPCIESFEGLRDHRPGRAVARAAMVVAAALIAACASRAPAPATSPPPPSPAPSTSGPTAPAPTAQGRARDWSEYQRVAANRLVQANPGRTYLGVPPEPLLAIPVLEVELNANGTIRRINVLRQPTQALDTVQLAIDAVQRAAPFGDVSHLPRPWRFSETFLFDDDRRFKPRTLDR